VPEGESWWFIGDETPLNEEMAAAFGLAPRGSMAVKTDLVEEAEAWLESFERTAYQGASTMLESTESLELPVSYRQDDDSIALLGYRLSQNEDELTVISAWRVEERTFPTGGRKIFVHLLAADGSIAGQDDSFAARYDGLFPKDLFFQRQVIALGDLEPGMYWLQMGLYDPESGGRLLADGADRLILGAVTVGIDGGGE
jgi:hypothetical protein